MILRQKHLKALSPAWMPFADAASEGLPLRQLLRLSLFPGLGRDGDGAASGHAEPGDDRGVVSARDGRGADDCHSRCWWPRSGRLLGHRSDTHRSAIGWKRVPYLWFGSLWQMGGLAVMPFALIVLSGDQTYGPAWAGEVWRRWPF
jgi:MFS transporter, BCD family, chlorophyll transporter